MRDIHDVSLEEVEEMTRRAIDAAANHIKELEEDVLDPVDEISIFVERLPTGGHMLDIGCGWARYVRYFVDWGLAYTGIDLSPKMVAAAKKNHPDLDFREMSFRKLAFPDGSFDGLWCCCVFLHEPKRNMPAVLSELRRVLKTGGTLAIINPYADWGEELVESMDCHFGAKEWYFASWDLTEFRKALEDAGFSVSEAFVKPSVGSCVYFAQK